MESGSLRHSNSKFRHACPLTHSPGFVAYYETGGDFVRRFDAHITVYGDDKEVTVTYDT